MTGVDHGAAPVTELGKIRHPREHSTAWYLSRSIWRDVRNFPRYGTRSPRWGQRIWIDPRECARYSDSINRSYIGQVLDGDWDLDTHEFENHPKFVACRQHWLDGLSWEETGIIDHVSDLVGRNGIQDDCRTVDDVISRYRRFDKLYEQVSRERRLRPRTEVVAKGFRELGGVLVHINRDNQPVFGNAGCHRLAIAQLLEIDKIPALLGAVHERALTTWKAKYLSSR